MPSVEIGAPIIGIGEMHCRIGLCTTVPGITGLMESWGITPLPKPLKGEFTWIVQDKETRLCYDVHIILAEAERKVMQIIKQADTTYSLSLQAEEQAQLEKVLTKWTIDDLISPLKGWLETKYAALQQEDRLVFEQKFSLLSASDQQESLAKFAAVNLDEPTKG